MSRFTPRKFILVGVVLGCLTAGVGHLLYVGHADLRHLVDQCNEEKRTEQQKVQNCNADDLSCQYSKQSSIVCNPEELIPLVDLAQADRNIQWQIKTSALNVDSRSTFVNEVALLLALACAIPALWHFLLARIRDISNAIRGK